MSSLGSNGSNNRLRSTIARDTTNDEAKNLKRKLSEETPRKLRRTANDDNQSGSDDEIHNSRVINFKLKIFLFYFSNKNEL